MLYPELREFFGGLSNVSDNQLGTLLQDATERVIDDGVNEGNPRFKKLKRYALGSLLSTTIGSKEIQGLGGTGSGEVKKKQVGDVSIEFNVDDSSGGTTSLSETGGGYEGKYLKELRNVIGLKHQLV